MIRMIDEDENVETVKISHAALQNLKERERWHGAVRGFMLGIVSAMTFYLGILLAR
jgi:hypothetical protein